MRTFTLNGWAQSVVVENDDGSTGITLTDASGDVTVVSIAGGATARVVIDAPSVPAPHPSTLEIQASPPEPKES